MGSERPAQWAGFMCIGWGTRITRRYAARPAGRRRYAPTFALPAGRASNLEVLILIPHTHKTRPVGGFHVYWLGDKDSNLG